MIPKMVSRLGNHFWYHLINNSKAVRRSVDMEKMLTINNLERLIRRIHA
jgi:hypothetical protein